MQIAELDVNDEVLLVFVVNESVGGGSDVMYSVIASYGCSQVRAWPVLFLLCYIPGYFIAVMSKKI